MGFNKPHSEESKQKISIGVIASGRKRSMGLVPWNKGKQHSDETKEKIRQARFKRKLKLGYIVSPETRIKISETNKRIGKTIPYEFSPKGENHPNWRGGITSLRHIIRNHVSSKKWRTDVLKRDNFTCQICHKIGGKLNADHIIPFSAIMIKYDIKTLQEALLCEKLFDLSNGRTLCVECHKKTDTYMYKARNYQYDNL